MSEMLDGALAAHAAFDRAAADLAPVEELANVRRLNNLLTAAWKHGFASKPPLDAGRIVERAIQAEHGPLASGEWETGLRLLSHDLQDHARLNPLGRTIAHGLLVRILRQRIRATALWQGHRDIASIPIQRPIILMGHMRSGTTRLHRLLSCDPRFSCTRTHENLQPVRRNHAAAIVQTSALLGVMNLCNPRLAQIHPVRASDAEEEYGLHAFSLHGAMFEAPWAVPRFARWCEERNLAPVYDEFYRLVQTLRWYRRDPPERIQVLKAPQFMQDARELLQTFPDARIIHLVRDPAAVVSSGASLLWNQRRIQSGHADPVEIGREIVRKTALREARAVMALADHGPSSVHTVEFNATGRDWLAEVRRIYDFLGMSIDSAAIARMSRLVRDKRHEGHRYSPSFFGLN